MESYRVHTYEEMSFDLGNTYDVPLPFWAAGVRYLVIRFEPTSV